jgi:hypothetical protein
VLKYHARKLRCHVRAHCLLPTCQSQGALGVNELNKANRDGKDPYVSILEYRNTPIDQIGSPAQLLMSRRLRSVVPTTKSLLQPKVIDEDLASSKLITKKTFQKLYYDRGLQRTSYNITRRASSHKARKNMESSCGN